MDFTVYTSAGGFRDFGGESTFNVGEQNGVLYVWEDGTDQTIVYGASAWASVQEKKLMDVEPQPAGRRRLEPAIDGEIPAELQLDPDHDEDELAPDEEPAAQTAWAFEPGPVFVPRHA